MLRRTRNELLIAGGFVLLVLVTVLFELRPTPNEEAPSRAGVVETDVVPGDHCPMLTSWVASPLQTSVGAWIDVGGAAVDADASETVSYAWTPATDFEKPTAPTTRYRCAHPGRQRLTLVASDDHQPRPCTTRVSLEVVCVAR
ncbi:MAG TPA: hypothetical protein VHJ20_03150 [Polyangia bacterium]|nr:hypothetical protein [Polyangia bacterium]